MFQTLNSNWNPRPLASGLIVMGLALLAMCFHPVLFPSMNRIEIKPPEMKYIRLVEPKQRVARALAPMAKPGDVKTASSREALAHAGTAQATPGTARWQALVSRGRDLTLDIVAVDSLPVLAANRCSLAFDVRRPRGKSLVLDAQDRILKQSTVPDGAIVREVQNMPRDYDVILKEAERQLGAPPRIYALYRPEVFYALRSLTYEALQNHRVPLDKVTLARVRLRLVSGGAFEVSLVGWEE